MDACVEGKPDGSQYDSTLFRSVPRTRLRVPSMCQRVQAGPSSSWLPRSSTTKLAHRDCCQGAVTIRLSRDMIGIGSLIEHALARLTFGHESRVVLGSAMCMIYLIRAPGIWSVSVYCAVCEECAHVPPPADLPLGRLGGWSPVYLGGPSGSRSFPTGLDSKQGHLTLPGVICVTSITRHRIIRRILTAVTN